MSRFQLDQRIRWYLMVTVDYSESFDQMVHHGQYDLVSSKMTSENWPIHGHGQKRRFMRVVLFGRTVHVEEILEYAAQNRLHLGRIEELLAVGRMYPDLQRCAPVLALGSKSICPVNGECLPMILEGMRKQRPRELCEHPYSQSLGKQCAFLFIKKELPLGC